jgi:hypothetical protein
MAEIEVGSYYSRWDLDDHVGRIQLYDTGNTLLFFQDTNSPEEFLAIVGMLRNEKPLWFEDTRNQLRTGLGEPREPVGEEESPSG